MPEPSSSARGGAIFSGAHPLARRLADRLGHERGPIIVVGDGSGRNSRALRSAGYAVSAVPDSVPYTQLPAPAKHFAGALASHAYLHGTSPKIKSGIAELARVLRSGAPVFLTLGSIDDVRYGFGERLDAHSYAPGDGPETGIPHAFFDRDGALEVLRPLTVISLETTNVDDIVGKWAHLDDEPPGKVHWFVEARKP
jgi:hypothetical protein